MDKIDIWGNLHASPTLAIEERHDGNFIRIQIYETGGVFLFGYQLKLGGVVKQKAPNTADAAFETADAARTAARKEIQLIGNANRSVRKIFAGFNKIRYNEQELFTEDMYEQCSQVYAG